MYILTRVTFNTFAIDQNRDEREWEIERESKETESYTYSSTALLTTQAYHIVLRQRA